jgi:hypothetical protein
MSNTIKDSLTTKKIDTINSNIEYFVDVINNNLKHLISIDSRDYLYIKINAILFVADKNSQFYNDGLFLKKYVKRIFELINPKYSNIKLTRVFESIEIKEKFYVLLKDYLYENWNTKIEQIISISPSESYIKNKQQSEQKLKFKEEEQKRKKLKAKFNDSKKIDNIKQ